MKILLLFMALLFCINQYGQNLPDSIQIQLDKMEKDTATVDWLLKKAWRAEIDLALLLNDEADRIAHQINAPLYIGRTTLLKGTLQTEMSQFDSGLINIELAERIFLEMESPKDLGGTYQTMQYIYMARSAFEKALEINFKGMEAWKKAGDDAGLSRSYLNIANIYYEQLNYTKAIEFCEKALQLVKDLDNKNALVRVYRSFARNYLLLPDHDKALDYINEALTLAKETDSPFFILSPLYNIRGNIYKLMGSYDEAIRDYSYLLGTTKSSLEKSVLNSNLAHVYKLKEDYESALPYILESLAIKDSFEIESSRTEELFHAKDIYAGLGDYKNALMYSDLLVEELEEETTAKIEQVESELMAKYESREQKATISRQKELLRQQRTALGFGIGGLTLLAILLVSLYRNYRNKQKHNRQLESLNTQLGKKNQENELLLKEIHHRVKNNLQVISSLLSLQSAHIQDPKVLDAVKESQNRVKSMGLIHQKLYQGENLAAIEMKDYLHTLGESMIDSFGEHAENININCEMDELELDVDTAIPLGLIVNELVTNSIKYAFSGEQVGEINIKLDIDEEKQLRLMVADNGMGNGNGDTSSIGSGTGFGSQLINLLTMQLNGKMHQESKDGMHTEIRFKQYLAA